jgi:2',3'-cyclic-nucleotide 2'-phosphodiesterase (5'-nucleotidase family)
MHQRESRTVDQSIDLKHTFKRIFEEEKMSVPNFRRATTLIVVLVTVLSLFTTAVSAKPQQAPATDVTFTILHTNDFHGQLEAANTDPNKISTPGMARTAKVINDIRTAKGPANVLLVDAGDEMQGSLLSNLGDGTETGKGIPTIATYNAMGYAVATFGNHEFDWGQENLANRTVEAAYPYVTANIVKNDTGNCSTAGWTKPDFADAPYVIKTLGTAPNEVKVAFIGVTTAETPTITVATATAGLCFKDPVASVVLGWRVKRTPTQAPANLPKIPLPVTKATSAGSKFLRKSSRSPIPAKNSGTNTA